MMKKYDLYGPIAAALLLFAHHHPAAAQSLPASPIATPPAGDDRSAWVGEQGIASYYGPGYHGRKAADGSHFDQRALTAAHPWLPFGTKVRVTLAATGRSVIVTITDRIYSSRRIVDLSVAAARQLGMISRGIAVVSLSPA